MPIPRKQQSTEADWHDALQQAYVAPDRARADELVAQAADLVRARCERSLNPAFGWSGGKDSQGLRIVCEAAGVTQNVAVISELEYPAFLAWLTDEMPWGCYVETRPLDLGWLRGEPEMLFPDTQHAARWFRLIQHAGQRAFCKTQMCDLLILGRRRSDGNYISKQPGSLEYVDRGGFVRFSPIADWSHEDLLTVLGAHATPLPPCYGWPRGFRVGTGAWPARQYCSREQGWAEVIEIDRQVVELAAGAGIPGAEEALCAASS